MKPFFKDSKTVAEINSCYCYVTEDTMMELKKFDKYTLAAMIREGGVNFKNNRGYTSLLRNHRGWCYGMQ